MPTAIIPQIPLAACTATAPKGSSTFILTSTSQTAPLMIKAESNPIIAAAHGATLAQGAVMATNPANAPLHMKSTSTYPVIAHVKNNIIEAPAAAAINVLLATTDIRKSVAARVLPALKPNQPKARIKVPITTYTRLWPGIALGVPSGLYFPFLGPSTHAPTNAIIPPIVCTQAQPAKSFTPAPKGSVLNQPPPHTQCPYIG